MTQPFADRPVRPAPATQLGDQAAIAVLGDNAPDVAREALKIARAESLTRPVLLVDLLGADNQLGKLCADEDPHGVSDSARYGLSLARVARPVPQADSLYVIPGGAESPLADDVLRDGMWTSWTEQCRRAGALLVVAGPADLPAMGRAVDQLDGLLMIGDATPPPSHVPLLGRIPTARRRTPMEVAAAPRRISPEEIAAVRQATPRWNRRVLAGAALGILALGLGGAGWAVATGRLALGAGGPAAARAATPIAASAAVATTVVPAADENARPWAVEIASVNSLPGALVRVRQSLASLPAPTLAATHSATGPTWYRLIAGAFATVESADSLLSALRAQGQLDPGGGRVVRAPLAFRLESGVEPAQLDTRLFGWRTIGVPAYALFDSSGIATIYAGAFESDSAARLFQPVLDSLNLHATLANRVGSIR